MNAKRILIPDDHKDLDPGLNHHGDRCVLRLCGATGHSPPTADPGAAFPQLRRRTNTSSDTPRLVWLPTTRPTRLSSRRMIELSVAMVATNRSKPRFSAASGSVEIGDRNRK